MNSEDSLMMAAGMVIPFVAFFLSAVLIKRHEKCISMFYWPLRERSPRSYVKQNIIIKKIRKRLGLDTGGSIHWMICLYHYLQIVMLTGPIFMLFLPVFLPIGKAIVISYVIGFGPYGLMGLIDGIFLNLQIQRCKKIKKTNPKYSKADFYNWRA